MIGFSHSFKILIGLVIDWFKSQTFKKDEQVINLELPADS
jgi:hypothetical protein